MQTLMAPMQEHLALKYRQQVEQIIGQPLPAEGQVLPPEQEAMLSQATAQATQEISQMAQQIAGTGQFDPLVKLKEQELQIEAAEVQRKASSDMAKQQLAAAKLQQEGQIKRQQIQSDEDIAALKAETSIANRR